ncbi:MAG TPA: hypothetical protein GXZ46_00250, partial [Actinomycetales bacterium]|nr:hypothetical protein [Actinomycetales bacterium]
PDQITVFGQSAGADLILSIMVAEGMAKRQATAVGKPYAPPFRRAILQSLPFGFLGGHGPMYDAMIDAAGPIGGDDDHESIAAAEERATEAARPFKNGEAMPWGVRYGAAPLPDESLSDDALAAIAPDIDILLGHTPREAALFFNDAKEAARLKKVPAVGGQLYERAMRFFTKATYGGSAKFAKKWVAAGGSALHYTLDWGARDNPYRSAHTCDLPLLLGDAETWRDSVLLEGKSWLDVAKDRRAMQAIWTQFAKTGAVAESVLRTADFLKVDKVG